MCKHSSSPQPAAPQLTQLHRKHWKDKQMVQCGGVMENYKHNVYQTRRNDISWCVKVFYSELLPQTLIIINLYLFI